MNAAEVSPPEVQPENILTGYQPGQLGKLLEQSNVRILLSTSPVFRDHVFLMIHHDSLVHPNVTSAETFGLYERADWNAFLSTLEKIQSQSGQKWTDFYSHLSTTLRSSIDLNYFFSQPQGEIVNTIRALGLFRRNRNKIIMNQTEIIAARKIYEYILDKSKGSDGSIPKALFIPDESGASQLDRTAEAEFLKELGTLSAMQRLQQKMYLVIAKADCVATRYLVEHNIKQRLLTRMTDILKSKLMPQITGFTGSSSKSIAASASA